MFEKYYRFIVGFFIISILLGDLAIAADFDMSIVDGEAYGNQFGSSIKSADLNGDGIEDLIVGSPFTSSSLMEWNGQVSIFWGQNIPDSQSLFSVDLKPDVNIYGSNSGDQFGTSIEVGDINDDGIDDLIVGAYNGNYNGLRVGKVYAFYGRKNWTNVSIDLSKEEKAIDLLFVGHDVEGNFGMSLNVADVNNDGYTDLLIGEPNNNEVHGYLGPFSSRIFGNSVIGTEESEFSFSSENLGEKFGSYIDSGDINGDSVMEILVSAYRGNFNGLDESGRIYVFENFDVHAENKSDYYFGGSSSFDWFGFYFELGDLNSDGVDDIAVSTFPYSDREGNGVVKIFKGGSDWKNLQAIDSFSKNNASSLIASSINISDVNGDSVNDLIVGAPGIGYPVSEDSGNVYVIYGPEYKSSDTDLYGLQADEWFGYRTESLDFNNDGFEDIAVGARYANGDNGVNHGRVYLFWGSEDGIKVNKVEEKINISDSITRGELISYVFENFKIMNREADFISNCYDYREFCMFEFLSRTNFDGAQLEPDVILYPDVDKNNKYYDVITAATMLGYVNGNIESENSPFKPYDLVSRIQALKIVLGSANLVKFQYQFELGDVLNQISVFLDVKATVPHMWWYPRYVNYAAENGIIVSNENFRPDDLISADELKSMIEKTLILLEKQNEETKS